MTTSPMIAVWRIWDTLSYNAMVVSLARRFRNGLNLQASYTWSKTLTDADSLIPFSYTSNNQREQAANSTNLRQDKAVSVQDLTNQFSLSYLYQLPFGKGRKWLNSNRALDLLVGGWQIEAQFNAIPAGSLSISVARRGIPYYQNCITLHGRTGFLQRHKLREPGIPRPTRMVQAPSTINRGSSLRTARPAQMVGATRGFHCPRQRLSIRTARDSVGPGQYRRDAELQLSPARLRPLHSATSRA